MPDWLPAHASGARTSSLEFPDPRVRRGTATGRRPTPNAERPKLLVIAFMALSGAFRCPQVLRSV
eukprot:9751033-Alexandrium_andersonii.AAC.1